MSLRIAMVGACPYPVPQGSQLLLRETARGLQSLGHDVRLVVYGFGTPGLEEVSLPVRRAWRPPWTPEVTAAGPNRWKPLHDAALALTLRRVCRDEAIDVVCAHNYEALLAALAVRHRPILYFAHNALADELPYYFQNPAAQGWARWLGQWFDRTFPRRADRVIVPHRRLAGYLVLRGCDPEHVAVIAPPVDLTAFGSTPSEESICPPVLYTGNLDAYQNLDLLFAAMDRVRQARPNARLQVLSTASCPRSDVEHLPDTGLESLRRALAEDVIVAAPRVSWSGYPMKLLNAMAAGRPVVACASAAWPLEDGINGLVVPDNDVAAFAAALMRLMDDARLRRDLGKNARETVSRGHTPVTVAKSIEHLALAALGRAGDSQESPVG